MSCMAGGRKASSQEVEAGDSGIVSECGVFRMEYIGEENGGGV